MSSNLNGSRYFRNGLKFFKKSGSKSRYSLQIQPSMQRITRKTFLGTVEMMFIHVKSALYILRQFHGKNYFVFPICIMLKFSFREANKIISHLFVTSFKCCCQKSCQYCLFQNSTRTDRNRISRRRFCTINKKPSC